MLEMVLDQVSWVATKKYQFPDIVNEMIMLTACKVLRSVISSILYQTWYLIRLIRQETSAIESSWSETYEINDDFCGLFQLDEMTSDYIYTTHSQYFLSLGISFENCRGQGYDGASNFQGHITGVTKRF